MNRRQFLKRSAAVGSALLGRDALEFSRQDLGVGSTFTAPRNHPLPRSERVSGRIANVEGTTAAVELTGRKSRSSVRVRVVRRAYPTGEVVNDGASDPLPALEAGDSRTVRVTVPRDGRTPGAWFYEAQVWPVADDARAYLCESRPYQWPSASGDELASADRVTEAPEPTTDELFERRLDGNEYLLTYRWKDARGATWEVDYRVRRSTHEAAVAGERGYVKTYEESLASPVVRDLAATLETDARRVSEPTGETSDAEESTTLASLDAGRRFDMLVRFVQHVEYHRDAASMETYDYNRTVPETLVAGVGDCKDRTHLLSGLLSASFGCETALLFQPGHVLLGVAAEDVPTLPSETRSVELGGRDIVPIEPSLRIPVGHHTDEPFVAAYGDGEWFYHDVGAVGGGIDDVARDWLDKTDLLP